MVLGIAAVYGEEISFERARELIGVLAAGFGFRALTRQVVKSCRRGLGRLRGLGYAGTWRWAGRHVVLERDKREPDPEELSKIRHWASEEEDFPFAPASPVAALQAIPRHRTGRMRI